MPNGRTAPLPEFYLNPGELAFSRDPCLIRTILGSCVALVAWDPARKQGGMCHYIMPECSPGNHSTKYGNIAIPALLKTFKNAGSHMSGLELSVFGGSLCLGENSYFFIGDKNVAVAVSMLERFHLRIKRMETGGNRGRRVILNCETGEINASIIPSTELSRLNII